MMDSDIKVSVFCTAFNHEKYIRNALEGFVMQKTKFKYEVLINDDASTDNTAAIIKEYENTYPEIIKPIYQSENQYSKGINITKEILFPIARGKYFAVCEGDDFWIDPLKLQKQYDFMETHPKCIMCFHNGKVIFEKTKKEIVKPNVSKTRKYSTVDIIKEPDGLFVTSSMFYRREGFGKTPECFRTPGFGDIQVFIHRSTMGNVYCLSDIMSVYRSGTKGSWTERTFENKNNRLKHYLLMVKLFDTMDEYYNYRYHNAFEYKKSWEMFNYYYALGDSLTIIKKPYLQFYKQYLRKTGHKLSIKERIALDYPFLVRMKKKIRLFPRNSG